MIDTTENIVLENQRTRLRPVQKGDENLLMQYALNEPETWEFSLYSAAGEDGMMRYIDKALEEKRSGYSLPFVVFDKKADAVAGCTRFYDIQNEHRSAQLGYTWYGKEFRGTGLNRHCKYLMLSFAFETADLERVEFRADADNARSIAAMRAIGCSVEGILRNHQTTETGKRRNSIILSILREEWLNGGKDRLSSLLL